VINPEFEQFLGRREVAARAYVRGDPGGVDAMAIPSGEGTFHSPKGDTVTGADAVRKRYRDDAASFQAGGESRFEVLQKAATRDLAFWTGFQIATVRLAGQDKPAEMRIRVTEVFRHFNGEWKMIHRHADMSRPQG
jgi:ketosteroid isomerase-like protein